MNQHKDRHIDEIVKEHIHDMELPMSGMEELWERINPEERKSRGFIFWLSGFALLFIAIGSYAVMNTADEENTVAEKIELRTETSQMTIEEPVKTIRSNKSSLLTKAAEVQKRNDKVEEKNSRIILDKQPDNLFTNSLLGQVQQRTSFDEQNNNYKLEQQLTGQQLIKKEVKITKQQLDEDYTSNNHRDRKLQSISKLIVVNPSLFKIGRREQKITLPLQSVHDKTTSIVQPLKKKRGAHFFRTTVQEWLPLDNLSVAQVDISQEDKAEIYKDLWEGYFTPLSSFGIEVNAGYKFNNGLGLFTGLCFLRTESQFEDSEILSARLLEYNERAYYRETGNGETEWYGSNVYRNQVLNITTYSKVVERDWSIPVGLEYDLVVSKNLRWSMNYTLLLELSKSYNGLFLNEDIILLDSKDPDNEKYFQTKLNIKHEFGSSFFYGLGQNFELVFSPRIRYAKDNMPLVNLVDHQRINIGASIGMNYVFEK